MPPNNPSREHSINELSAAMNRMKSNLDVYETEEKLVIALDFGTTYSGIAFCFPNQRDTKVVAIVDWPGAEGESAPKIPTIINYNPKNSEKFAWGASVNRMKDSIIGVKLLLDPSQERPLYLPTGNIKQDLKKLPKPAVEVAADFIRAMYEHALQEITKEVPDNYMTLCQKQFVFSVPAVWSDAAKNATLEAAKLAGLHPVTLIKEPEAAALYTMHSLDFALNIGDAFVICDAGGGTVDLISYEVVSVTPKLEVKELVPGTGGMAGSLGLNQRFVEAVKTLVGEDQFHELRKTKGFLLAEKGFDREVKKAFRNRSGEEYFINFPMATLEDDPEAGLESNTWRMTKEDVKAIFAPLVTDILRLINDQVKSVKLKRPDRGITGVVLVGGFGSSQYLKSCVEEQHPGLQVLQPNDAWAAIVKGAALSQVPREAIVVSTSSTKHYGVEVSSEINDVLDKGRPVRTERDGTIRVLTMSWYIGIGDDVKREQEIRFPFTRDLNENFQPSELIFTDRLYECEDPVAPRHRASARKLQTNCELTSDLTSIDRSKLVKKIDKEGLPYYRVHFNLVVTLKSAVMEFSLEVDGKQMGMVRAKFGNT